MTLLNRLLQERDTCENFVHYIHSEYIQDHVHHSLMQTLDVLSGSTSLHEMEAIQNALRTMDDVLYEKLIPGDLHTLSLYMTTMCDSYKNHGTLYTIAQQLLHDVHICEIYESQPSDCPDFIRRWYEVVQFAPETPMLERLRTCMEHIRIIRDDLCYTAHVKDRVEKDIRVMRDDLINELYMSYHIINETDMHEILTLLEVPEGLQSLILECTWESTNSSFGADDYMYVFIGVCLLISIGSYCFYRFQRKSIG